MLSNELTAFIHAPTPPIDDGGPSRADDSGPVTIHSFSGITLAHQQQSISDAADISAQKFGPPTPWQPIKLSELFDLENGEYWDSLYSRFAGASFEDDLALYELADLDADGENDGENDGDGQNDVLDATADYIQTAG